MVAACVASSSTTRASHPRRSQKAAIPIATCTTVSQTSDLRTDATASSSGPAVAICRVADIPTDIDAIPVPTDTRFWNSPIRPTPAGPRIKAAAFCLAIPAPMLTTEAAPMIEEERRIWPNEL